MKTRQSQLDRNNHTAEAVKKALQKLRPQGAVVLATVASSKKGHDPYPIKLGANNTVFCPCKGFQYRNECRHMKRFRAEFKPQTFK